MSRTPPHASKLPRWLAGHEPGDERERDDLVRVEELLARAADPYDRALAFHVTGSALVAAPASRRVLLRWHERQASWLQVGGHGDPGEADPFETALREAREETALEDLVPLPLGQVPAPLHVVVVRANASAAEPAHEHADVRYLLATSSPERAHPEKPSAPLRWCTPEEAVELADGNLAATILRAATLF